jgi:hypothetical protein
LKERDYIEPNGGLRKNARSPRTEKSKSFLFLFFKKEMLSCFAPFTRDNL